LLDGFLLGFDYLTVGGFAFLFHRERF
jgi:hypothetical protein